MTEEMDQGGVHANGRIVLPDLDDDAPAGMADLEADGEEPEESAETTEEGEEQAADDADSDADSGESEEAPEDAKKKGKPDKEIARRDYLLRQARREAQEARRLAEELRQRIEAAPAQKAAEAVSPPDPSDMSKYPAGVWDDKYQKDYQEWIGKELDRRAAAAAEKAAAEAQMKARQMTVAQKGNEVGKKGVDKYPDFEQVVLDAFEAMPADRTAIVSLIETADNAEDVLYYLGKNPEVLEQITAKSPMAQALELGKLADRLDARRKSSETAKRKITKAAPAPAKPRAANGQFVQGEDALYTRLLERAGQW